MRTAGRLTVLALACALLLALGAWWRGVTWTDVAHFGTPRNAVVTETGSVRVPLPTGEATRRLPEVDPGTTGIYAFLFPTGGEGGGPVRYDPCREIPWVLAPRLMPDGAEELVHEAIASVSAATGLAFAYEGTTDEIARFSRPLLQERYGDRFAPLVVGFATEDDEPDLAGTVTGLGGSTAVAGAYGAGEFLRSGVVILDAEDLASILAEDDGAPLAQAVVAHELGHVVGLAHVPDAGEPMHEANLRQLTWGPGDRRGLALAGAGACEDV